MREYPVVGSTLPAVLDFIRSISILRRDDVQEISNLNTRFLRGRLRTDRTTPSANTDVNSTDKEGDVVRTATYEYVVVNDAGTLKWARFALDVTW